MILTNRNVIDPVNPHPKPQATVLIEDGHILEVRDGGPPPSTSGDRLIDLDVAYLLPGLWDVHIHPEHPNPAGTTVAPRFCP